MGSALAGRLVRGLALAGVVVAAPVAAFAQAAGPQPAPAADTSVPAPAPSPAPTPGAGAAPAGSGSPAPAGSAEPSKPVVPATGYGWTTHPAKHGRTHVRASRAAAAASANPTGTVVPGFETLGDGSSRVFVQLPRATTYATRSAKGSLTYVLKGISVDRRNNLNALVTVHFNTPVTSARLVPHGSDLWLVVDLRANVQPTVALDATKDGGAMFRVEFPKGDYLSGAPSPTPPATAPSGAASTTGSPSGSP
jgi:hypothetical protein